MKGNAILITFLILSITLFSQTNNFAPVGAKWWYDYNNSPIEGYTTLEVVGDTLIADKNCRILSSIKYTKDISEIDPEINITSNGRYFIYSDSDKVYQYVFGKFYKLYDFNALIGDNWEVAGVSSDGICDSTEIISIDSISNITINTFNLFEFYSNSVLDYYWGFGIQPVIERLGSLNFLFPNPENCLFDYYKGGPLRCYYDVEFGYFQADSALACDYIHTNISNPGELIFNLWPNPFNSELHIAAPYNTTNSLLRVFDITGNLIINTAIDNQYSSMNFSDLRSGLYIFDFYTNSVHKYLKIVKL